MHKKGHKLKASPLLKNPQFSSNLADIEAKLPTHDAVILIKFHKDCNFFFNLSKNFWLVPFFMHHPLLFLKFPIVYALLCYRYLFPNILIRQGAINL